MRTTFGLITTLFLAYATALAAPPAAPPPHPALGEVVKEYRRLGLPIPSPKAELVRVTRIYTQETHTYLALRHPSTIPGKLPQYQTNTGSLWALKPDREVIVQPIPASLEGAPPWDGICFVAQCKLRGWDELAAAAYAECMKPDEQAPPNAIAALRLTAWYYWESQLTERYSDRKEAFTQMSAIAKWDPSLVTWRKQTLLPDLKKTIAPRKSKPGSIEAIIDDLTEDWTDPDDWENEVGQTAYWKLVELGFDAVPALMAHIEDTRLTRSQTGSVRDGLYRDVMRVNDRVEYILDKLSGERFSAEHRWATADEWKPPKEHKWWAEAQKLSEEKWLMKYVIPADAEERDLVPNEIILRVIRAKYPQRLKDVYQIVLLKRPKVRSDTIAKAIALSKLPQKDKVAILEEGIVQGDSVHRSYALEALADLDLKTFQNRLIRVIESFPGTLELRIDGNYWEPGVVGLVRKTEDPKCWAALMAASRRVSTETRLYFIRVAGWPAYPGEPDPGRREALGFLLRFVNVGTAGGVGAHDVREARDLATLQLGKHFGLVDWKLDPQKELPLRTPRELSLLRDRVRELAERELARPTK